MRLYEVYPHVNIGVDNSVFLSVYSSHDSDRETFDKMAFVHQGDEGGSPANPPHLREPQGSCRSSGSSREGLLIKRSDTGL